MNRTINVGVLLAIVVSMTTVAGASRTVTVPGDFPTIQAAIDAAVEGDEIVVLPGTYMGAIQLRGTNIVLRSTDPKDISVVTATILDGGMMATVVTFAGTESPKCILEGFTIMNGFGTNGGGIQGNGTLATIRRNFIKYNMAESGGGIHGCNGTIRDNRIMANACFMNGGAIAQCHGAIKKNLVSYNFGFNLGGALYDCDGSVRNNVIFQNLAFMNGSGMAGCDGEIQNNIVHANPLYGFGAVGCLYACNGRIENDTIYGGGSPSLAQCGGTITNCILANGVAPEVIDSSMPTYSCILNWTSGGTGNLSVDFDTIYSTLVLTDATDVYEGPVPPLYIRLAANSPCIDAGTAIEGLDEDFEDDPRPLDGTPEPRGDGSDFDIGADEYVP